MMFDMKNLSHPLGLCYDPPLLNLFLKKPFFFSFQGGGFTMGQSNPGLCDRDEMPAAVFCKYCQSSLNSKVAIYPWLTDWWKSTHLHNSSGGRMWQSMGEKPGSEEDCWIFALTLMVTCVPSSAPGVSWLETCVFMNKYSCNELLLWRTFSTSIISIWNIVENMHTDIKLDIRCLSDVTSFTFHLLLLRYLPHWQRTMAFGSREELSLFLAQERPPTHPYQHVTGPNWLCFPSVLTPCQRLHNEIIILITKTGQIGERRAIDGAER